MDDALLARQADEVYDAARALAHMTSSASPVPAPAVYSVLGNTNNVAFMLAESTESLAHALAASPEGYTLTEANPQDDPLDSIAAANQHLHTAAALLRQAGVALSEAQSAIAGQGYSGRR